MFGVLEYLFKKRDLTRPQGLSEELLTTYAGRVQVKKTPAEFGNALALSEQSWRRFIQQNTPGTPTLGQTVLNKASFVLKSILPILLFPLSSDVSKKFLKL